MDNKCLFSVELNDAMPLPRQASPYNKHYICAVSSGNHFVQSNSLITMIYIIILCFSMCVLYHDMTNRLLINRAKGQLKVLKTEEVAI